ncbi:potassium transporter KtrB [Eubacterium sp. MSJ-13]|uniref:TrkH family potassium uptake protein n=1 Tax=Eubacterium sp. MSJ-13 TaxID=2841513 RepID=UPI001C122246|nr:potassium transporter TrkG [Eubacterium sp. MSJ-13]MBU5478888.1 potassium transporter KtrB [Eubacterium sp. MSJ-13]
MFSNLNKELSTTQIIALGFLGAIFIGAVILCLPFSSADGSFTPFIDALFTSTTSVCVTGLVVVNTATHWSLFGKIIILILIQLGGLGIVSFVTGIMMAAGSRITLSDRLLLEDALNLSTLKGLVRFLKFIFRGTFIIEITGAICYSFVFVPDFGLIKGLWFSLFHAVSAFCNAGIDLLGENSLEPYASNLWINLVTMFLIVSGGIGFVVWRDIQAAIKNHFEKKFTVKKSLQKLRLHTKITLITTIVLIFGGAVLIFILEYTNSDTIGKMNVSEKIIASLFQSVTLRTAGFTTFSQAGLRHGTVLLCYFLMIIGGSSIGTAGGIKTTTVATLFLSTRAVVRGKTHLVVFRKNIPHQTVTKALAVTMVSISFLLLASVVLYQAEGGSMIDVVYETTSAIATVGLTRDYTSKLHLLGKLIIIVCMYLGRIGPISMVIFFNKNRRKDLVSFPHEDITVG